MAKKAAIPEVELKITDVAQLAGVTVGTKEMCVILGGVSSTIIQQAGNAGLLKRAGVGRWYLVESVAGYVSHQREMTSGRMMKSASGIDLVEESGLLKRAQRVEREQKLAIRAGELVSIPEVMTIWGDIVKTVRSMVASWPTRAHSRLPHLTEDDLRVMREEADTVLNLAAIKENPEIGPLPGETK